MAELISLYLEKECFETHIAPDGAAALSLFHSLSPDLVLLDLMLPHVDGYQVCREIRKSAQTPVIMLSAKGEVFDKVLGLELGADDYIIKPFEPKELVARVRAVLRRYRPQEAAPSARADTDEYAGDTRTVDVHIKRLREKLKDKPSWSIATVWGVGYKFDLRA